jgi:Holliday junction DNA helicase RuvA
VIAFVSGPVAAVTPTSAVVEVGGVGMLVHCGPGTLAALTVGEKSKLFTAMVVREDSLTLYGFADDDEKQIFELLQTASGVGPRLAQAVLAVHQPDSVRRAVSTGDIVALTRVPGIGKKGAERLVLELRDRIGSVPGGVDVPAGVLVGDWPDQVRQGVLALGWTAAQADQAVSAVAQSIDGEVPPVPVLLRQAIRLLGRAR